MKIFKIIITFVLITYSIQANASQLNKLYIVNKEGGRNQFDVEVAKTFEQREVGLMFRNHLPENQGMLFVFEKNAPVSMWMKNTYIPLDILFIDKEGIVTNIAKNTVPHSLKLISSARPVVAALEINAMVSDKLGIKAGDKIENLSDYYKVD